MQVKKSHSKIKADDECGIKMRDPTVLASTASESLEKTKSESQNIPLSSLNVQQTRTGRLVVVASSSNYSEWNIGDKWCSEVWKPSEMSNTSTERPVFDKFVIDEDMDSDSRRFNARH